MTNRRFAAPWRADGYVVRARLVDVVIIKSVSPIHARMLFPCLEFFGWAMQQRVVAGQKFCEHDGVAVREQIEADGVISNRQANMGKHHASTPAS